jgi:transcriptional regulator with XRE-family HTH domain
MALKSFNAILSAAKNKDSYWIEALKHDFALELHGMLNKQGIRAGEFATKMGVSAPYISRVLRGDENLTVASLVKIARAAGAKISLHLSESDCDVRWLEVWNCKSLQKDQLSTSAWKRSGLGHGRVMENNWAANDHENESAAA